MREENRKRRLAQLEAEFREVLRGAVRRDAQATHEDVAAQEAERRDADRRRTALEQEFAEALRTSAPPSPPSAGRRRRPPQRALRKLARQGRVPVDREIDLHGLTLAQAETALAQMLASAAARDERYLRVITGKGLHTGGTAVLPEAIPAQLRRDPRVAEVVQAVRAVDGGRGAWFVRLRAQAPRRS